MGKREEMLKEQLESIYGSIPKFCETSGLAKSTVYNIFDRGIENTRTKTMETVYAYVDNFESGECQLSEEEAELVELFGKMSGRQRAAMMDMARAMVG